MRMATEVKTSIVGTQLVAVFLSVYDVPKGAAPLTLCGGGDEHMPVSLLHNFGPSQHLAKLAETTIGALRESWGDDTVGGELNPATKAWLYSDDNGNGGVTTVLVRMPIVAGWGDE